MLPKLFDLNGFFLPTYGVLVAIAFLVAIAITARLAKKVGLPSEKVTNLAIYCAIAGMIGAKVAMILFDWRIYASQPSELWSFSTLQAAGVFQGGLVAAVLTAVLYMRHQGLPGLLTADTFAPGIAIGHAIGRIGCFSAGCCWGTSCDRSWAVTFRNPDAAELTGVPLNVPLHPTQLYEASLEFLIFGFLFWYFHRSPRPGAVLGAYLILYSIARFIVEFFRHHEQSLVAGLSLTQWISAALLMAGVWLLMRPRTATQAA